MCVCVLCNVYFSSLLLVSMSRLTHQILVSVRIEIVFGVRVCVFNWCVCVCAPAFSLSRSLALSHAHTHTHTNTKRDVG